MVGRSTHRQAACLAAAAAAVVWVLAGNAGSAAAAGPRPVRLMIPAIEVNAAVEHVGMDAARAMATPSTDTTVAWFRLGYIPGTPGNAAISGHLDRRDGSPAIFWRLGDLAAGSDVFVQLSDGRRLRFVVQGSASYGAREVPVSAVFGELDVARLNLITCEPPFDRSVGQYAQRRVVYTTLAEEIRPDAEGYYHAQHSALPPPPPPPQALAGIDTEPPPQPTEPPASPPKKRNAAVDPPVCALTAVECRPLPF